MKNSTSQGSHKHSLALLICAVFYCLSGLTFAHQDPDIAGYINVDGGRIWYRINGAHLLGKQPAIIAIHGGPGMTHRGTMPYVALSNEYPVILYDQLDTGNSDRPGLKQHWNIERFVAEIDHIRQALKLGEVIVAGHSWGGTLAAEYAVRRPSGLKATILSSPLLSTSQWNKDNQQWISLMPEKEREILQRSNNTEFDSSDYRAAVKAFYKRHMCRKEPCTTQSYKDDGPALNLDMYVYMWGRTDFKGTGTLKDYDLSARLNNITVPTLMICGEYDEAMPRSCRRFSWKISTSETVIVPDAGHQTLFEAEAFYVETVRRFIQKNIGTAPKD